MQYCYLHIRKQTGNEIIGLQKIFDLKEKKNPEKLKL
jgi:hypothetical protein